jgi:hypothetical protein
MPTGNQPPTNLSDSQLLTSEEVMDRLLSDARLRRLASLCVLKAVRHENEWRFRRGDLEAWIAEQISH